MSTKNTRTWVFFVLPRLLLKKSKFFFYKEGVTMDRTAWLKERRQEAEQRYSTWWAPLYGEKYGKYPNSSHLQFIQRFLDYLSQNSSILNAACGAGRYMEQLLEKGHTVIGIDQAAGMLARAKEFFPQVHF